MASVSRRRGWLSVAAALLAATGCTAGGAETSPATSAPAITICDPGSTEQAADDLPKPALIASAVGALEADLGGPQRYFEINVTARLVNLFVALNDGAVAQPWVYVDGELTSKEGQAAQGGTFTAADMRFDPAAVLGTVRTQVPGAVLESFYVLGDGKGTLQYGVLASARCGGGLDVTVGADGAVLGVDPN